MKHASLVALNEYKRRMRQLSVILSMALIALLIVGAGVVVRILSENGTFSGPDRKVAVTAEMETWGKSLKQNLYGRTYEVIPIKNDANFQQILKDGVNKTSVDWILAGSPDAPKIISSSELSSSDKTVVQALQRDLVMQAEMNRHGLTQDALQVAVSKHKVQMEVVEDKDTVTVFNNPGGFATACGILSILIILLIQTLQMLGMGVVEEKSSRVVEVLLSAVSPLELLAGKLLGFAMLVATQVIVYLVACVVAVKVAGAETMFAYLDWNTIYVSLVWFVLAFAIFSSLQAAIASTASRQEDIGAATAPLTLLLVVPFYLAIYLVPAMPNATIVRVLSFVPFFGPLIMPTRSVFGVSLMEHLLVLLVTVLWVPVIMWIAARIYRNSILQMGKRIGLLKALRG